MLNGPNGWITKNTKDTKDTKKATI